MAIVAVCVQALFKCLVYFVPLFDSSSPKFVCQAVEEEEEEVEEEITLTEEDSDALLSTDKYVIVPRFSRKRGTLKLIHPSVCPSQKLYLLNIF